MTVLVDTSAILALRNPGDRHHEPALAAFERLAATDEVLLTTSYVLVETYALLTRRLGVEAARAFSQDLAPLLDVEWVSGDVHHQGLKIALAGGRRGPSLVDATAFVVGRSRGITTAFAFDEHFARAGFRPA